eukprot:2689015-Amphidinium_carterae.3
MSTDYNMMDFYRELRNGMDLRIQQMYSHVNYGRGIPVVISSLSLTPDIITLLGVRIKTMENKEWTNF